METIYAAEVVYSEETTDGWRIRTKLEAFAEYRDAVRFVDEWCDYYKSTDHYRFKIGQVHQIDKVRA